MKKEPTVYDFDDDSKSITILTSEHKFMIAKSPDDGLYIIRDYPIKDLEAGCEGYYTCLRPSYSLQNFLHRIISDFVD